MPSRRSLIASAFIFLCALTAGLFHARSAHASEPDDPIRQNVKLFTKVYDLVEQNFADPVKPDQGIYTGAIPGMLRELDPHSSFFDP